MWMPGKDYPGKDQAGPCRRFVDNSDQEAARRKSIVPKAAPASSLVSATFSAHFRHLARVYKICPIHDADQ